MKHIMQNYVKNLHNIAIVNCRSSTRISSCYSSSSAISVVVILAVVATAVATVN